jgi:U32 family peptidase
MSSAMQIALSRPELLAPAGNGEMMRAAVENGADAIYFGLEEFNARLRASNFKVADLPDIMAWLHERGVKGYITLNTLVFPSELEDAAKLLMACSAAGVDAVLVQDLGVAALAARLVPDLPIHASTQMTLTSAESIEAAEALGLRLTRVVAARETSIKELRTMRKGTSKEIEVFVHGALCVAYSGQCLTSEALGGRSANRGECAQACRLPYDLIVDGEMQDTGDVKYLLSPKDLAAYEDLDKLVEAGIACLKIEGRLKSPEYVAATVQSYRAALDAVIGDGDTVQHVDMDPATQRKLEMTFSRGFTGGYLHDINHQAVVEGRFPKKRGAYLGRVTRTSEHAIGIWLEAPLRAGDGVVFDSGAPQGNEEGGRVYMINVDGEPQKEHTGSPSEDVDVEFGRGALNHRRINIGDRVWKTSDPRLDRELAASYEGDEIRIRRPVDIYVRARVGEPLGISLTDFDGNNVTFADTVPCERAQKQPLTYDALEKQVARLGNTPFQLGQLSADIDPDVMVPFSRLNDLRRRAVDALIDKRRSMNTKRRLNGNALTEMRKESGIPQRGMSSAPALPRLSVMCRSLEQVRAAAAHPGVNVIYTDFEDIRVHADARDIVKSAGKQFVPASLRVMKPGEAGIVRKLLQYDPDAILVRNLGALHVLQNEAPTVELIADYSFNIPNELTAGLLYQHGLKQLTPSYDLNIEQLMELLSAAPADWFEVTIHQHLPMFHMEHCVFCRFLSTGTDFTNCGRPCDTHTLAVRDRMGYEHPVKADAGCRNTVYNAVAQSASEYIDQMLAAGVNKYRIEFIAETAGQVQEAIDLYLPVLQGETKGTSLWRKLKAISKLGVTRGSLDHD